MENEEEKGLAEPGGESSPAEAAVEAEGEEGIVEAAIEGEGLEYRGALIRLLALFIDVIAIGIIAGVLAVILNAILGDNSTAADYTPLIAGFIYLIGFWSWRGQTPGKMVIRAKIVKSDGSTIGFSNAILRYLFYLVPFFTPILFFAERVSIYFILVPIVNLIIIALNTEKRGLHDMIAGTCVIDSRAIVLEPYTDELAQPSDDEEA